ncbi:MAG: hypothetical protein AAFN91_17450 [Pseudomonadota bacterium]
MSDTEFTTAAFNRMAQFVREFHDGSKPETEGKGAYLNAYIQDHMWYALFPNRDSKDEIVQKQPPNTLEQIRQNMEIFIDPDEGFMIGLETEDVAESLFGIELGCADDEAREHVIRRYREATDQLIALAND